MNFRNWVRRWAIPAVLSSMMIAAGGTARGQDLLKNLVEALGLGGRAEPQAVEVVIEAAPDFFQDENPFVPQIKTLLAAELHFVQKVCEPNDAQMDEIRQAGLVEVERLAKRFAAVQQQNRRDGWPDARAEISEALWNKIFDVMPTEVAERYSDELTAREEARKQAAAEMMTTLVDQRVSLLPSQYEGVTAAILANWQDRWARDLQLFLYEDFAPAPTPQMIHAALTERQRQRWHGGSRNGVIAFGWEHELGLDWGPQVQLGRDLVVDKEPAAAAGADDINRTHFQPKPSSGPTEPAEATTPAASEESP